MRANPSLMAITDELEKWGIAYRVVTGGKHLRVWWRSPDGKDRYKDAACTASDWRAPLNNRSAVRRLLAADGLLRRA